MIFLVFAIFGIIILAIVIEAVGLLKDAFASKSKIYTIVCVVAVIAVIICLIVIFSTRHWDYRNNIYL